MPKFRPGPFSPRTAASASRLTPLTVRGRNPGALAAHVHVPAALPAHPALVVVLHGCTQTAGGYDQGAGWSTLADRHGFILLFPEQQRANNGNLCFNWFEPGDIARGKGEVESIREMIAQVAADHAVDPARIFVTGLSAGGAMAAVMLAVHPEIFAAGAVIAGLPSGYASSVQEALELMRSGPRATAIDRNAHGATDRAGRWPRLSVWHGDADRTVSTANADALVRQWTVLHGLPGEPSRRETVSGHVHRVWTGADGTPLLEDYRIAGMGHGTPLSTGDGDDRCGTAGAFMLEAGISSSHAIARFFEILDAAPQQRSAAAAAKSDTFDPLPAIIEEGAAPPRRLEVIGRSRPESADLPSGVQKVIETALRSAGLMK